MGRKCSAFKCDSGYNKYRRKKTSENISDKNKEQIRIYSFPKNLDDRKAWVRALPNAISVENITENMGLCSIHFKDCKNWRKGNRFPVPNEPPTYFPNVPKSTIGTPQPAKRKTSRATASARCPDPDDEFNDYIQNQVIKLDDNFTKNVTDIFKDYNGNVMFANNGFSFLSAERNGPLHNCSIYFKTKGLTSVKVKKKCTKTSRTEFTKISSIEYEGYAGLQRVRHPAHPVHVSCWSAFEEVVRFIHADHEKEDKSAFLQRQIQLLVKPKNCRLYDLEDISQAYVFYSLSRHLYCKLRKVLQLPSGMVKLFYLYAPLKT